ncbi:FimB/Mfa2 family fimbrial subunit [uncultured Alistipes sp.]|uniref:FimB/Mfa2 family fimbrial subunit n=1 Tax=uncultured Alistipes sp. TaxID=538949 RepID=UPI002625FFB5|nr:FimB/Mfa2 family fimbrial subunit [uncultured Alistipes sp.]
MKVRQYINMMGMAAAVLLSSCVKDTLYDTPHPDHGKIAVTADWSARGEGIDIPATWTVTMGDYTGTETSATHAPDHLFAPGSYTLAVWNPAEGITVSGTTATIAAATGNRAGTDAFVDNAPGWFFTHAEQVTIEQDKDHAFTAAMKQQVRELTLVIEPTGDAAGRITEIAASLTGAAGTLDFATDTYGAASSVVLPFTKITEGADAGKWTATVRLLGVTGTEQLLTGEIRYADGNPLPTTLESDLTEALKEFNAKKTEPLTLGGTLVETPEGMEVDGAGITGWKPVEGDDVNADL